VSNFAAKLFMRELLIITTGGTIDKVYFDDLSDYQIGEPQAGKILESVKASFAFQLIGLMRKDSLHLNADDRALIRLTVSNNSLEHVLITHGTDTMVETAAALQSIPGKTIVLTGALSPARFQGSDAPFNIGAAVGALQSLPNGVWICMNGQVFDSRNVRKNRSAGRFELMS
jgi:L-asparaginase